MSDKTFALFQRAGEMGAALDGIIHAAAFVVDRRGTDVFEAGMDDLQRAVEHARSIGLLPPQSA